MPSRPPQPPGKKTVQIDTREVRRLAEASAGAADAKEHEVDLLRALGRIRHLEIENAQLSGRVAEMDARLQRIEKIARGEHDPGRE